MSYVNWDFGNGNAEIFPFVSDPSLQKSICVDIKMKQNFNFCSILNKITKIYKMRAFTETWDGE